MGFFSRMRAWVWLLQRITVHPEKGEVTSRFLLCVCDLCMLPILQVRHREKFRSDLQSRERALEPRSADLGSHYGAENSSVGF